MPGKGLNRGERGAASLCGPHPYRWQGEGWQRDDGRSWLFGLPRDGHLSPALHGCLCHYLHSARFLFKCWGTLFPPSKCVQHEHGEESIKDWSTWVTFLISSSQGGDIEINESRRTKFTGHTSAKKTLHFDNLQWRIYNFPILVKCWKKTLNVSSFFKYLAEKWPLEMCQQRKSSADLPTAKPCM